jgi:hypothetical protein
MIALAIIPAYAALIVTALFILWLMFVVAMALKLANKQNRLTVGMVTFGKRFVIVGQIYDVLCNILCASVIFFEEPREATVSQRLQRLVVASRWAWQRRLAIWFAVVLMNPFCEPDDPHIRIPEL